MIARLGDLLVLLALAASVVGAFAAARSTRDPASAPRARLLVYAFALAMALAVATMEYALVTHDFSVRYVAKVGSLATPLYVTVTSLWSSLEGSILLWGLVLGAYAAAFARSTRREPPETTGWAIAVHLVVGAFFALLLAGPANPFSPGPDPVPADGPGPNPLLQDHVLMIVHPPSLYLGYVGMTIPFGIAVGALLRGELGAHAQALLRRWLLVPWTFLSLGITLGGWWAYEVLGWGGYWAWDPVENASLLPWLTATAALHAAMLPARRAGLSAWTLTLVLITFLLTLLGTFMTRSGVFNSVHSFSQSEIGPVFLGAIAVAGSGCVALLAARVDRLSGEGASRAALSRESAFLVNNLLFVCLTFTVLVGTTFPLLAEAFRGTKLSVGAPYFDRMAVPIGVALLYLLAIGPALPWGEASGAQALRAMRAPLAGGVAAAAVALALGVGPSWALVVAAGAGMATVVTAHQVARPVAVKLAAGAGLGQAVAALLGPARRRTGGYLVHLGVIAMIVGIAMSSTFRVDQEFQLSRGEVASFQGRQLAFLGAEVLREPHRERHVARIAVDGRDLSPELRTYPGSMTPIGSPAVRSTWKDDLYLSAMRIEPDGSAVAVHAYLQPLVAWIWVGGGIVVLGALLASVPSRRAA